MKIDVSVDMKDFFEELDGEKLETVIAFHVKEEIMKIVKKDPRYKAFVNKKAEDTLAGLKI